MVFKVFTKLIRHIYRCMHAPRWRTAHLQISEPAPHPPLPPPGTQRCKNTNGFRCMCIYTYLAAWAAPMSELNLMITLADLHNGRPVHP